MLRNNTKTSLPGWLLGMAVASIFSLAYLLVPVYLLSATAGLVCRYPSTKSSLIYALPMLLSIFVKPRASFLALRLIRPMLDYFDFEAIYLDENVRSSGKNFIFAAQPHGVLSFCGICAAVSNPKDTLLVPTAAASVVLRTPLLKNLMGIFNLIDASAGSLRRHLKSGGSVLIYVGGIAELFKSCRTEERLYLKERKGFIKLALTEGVDVVPAYLFGNSSVLSVLKHGPLAALSRKLQVSLTIFWGKFYLPIPRDEKLLYVVGKPIGLPHLEHPKQEDIDKWHAKYCDEVRVIYETFKEKVPMYKHKRLFID
ncbi:hypothetical protein ACHAW5_011301 [Stephanodiscus triporus]|uniref:Acyltransferase n=1 Tax=Stephanodiscus triporus TaxID=2934178 RepID=A0ABD3ML25_9STRA